MDNNFFREYEKFEKEFDIGYVRVFHAVPNLPDITVYLDDNLVTTKLAYANHTDYLPVSNGNHTISLYIEGEVDVKALVNTFTIEANDIFTIALIGTIKTISLLAITDSNQPIDPQFPLIRFVQLSYEAPQIDITLLDGTVLFDNLEFKDITPYITLDQTLQVRLAGTTSIFLTIESKMLEPNAFHSIYFIGNLDRYPRLRGVFERDMIK